MIAGFDRFHSMCPCLAFKSAHTSHRTRIPVVPAPQQHIVPVRQPYALAVDCHVTYVHAVVVAVQHSLGRHALVESFAAVACGVVRGWGFSLVVGGLEVEL